MTRPWRPELCLFKPLTETQTRWLEKSDRLAIAPASRSKARAPAGRDANRLIRNRARKGIFGTDTEGRITLELGRRRMLGIHRRIRLAAQSRLVPSSPPGWQRLSVMEECPMYAAYTRQAEPY